MSAADRLHRLAVCDARRIERPEPTDAPRGRQGGPRARTAVAPREGHPLSAAGEGGGGPARRRRGRPHRARAGQLANGDPERVERGPRLTGQRRLLVPAAVFDPCPAGFTERIADQAEGIVALGAVTAIVLKLEVDHLLGAGGDALRDRLPHVCRLLDRGDPQRAERVPARPGILGPDRHAELRHPERLGRDAELRQDGPRRCRRGVEA